MIGAMVIETDWPREIVRKGGGGREEAASGFLPRARQRALSKAGFETPTTPPL